MLNGTGKAVKNYRQGNIPAAFGSDLWLSGATNVPNLLLKFYKEMNLTDSEVMTLIHMFRLRCDECILCPDTEKLSRCMSAPQSEIEGNIRSLFEKKFLVETLYYNEDRDEVLTGYDFEPLFEKLSDQWAVARAREIEKAGKKIEAQSRIADRKELALCCSSFEKEFGRPLSPIEMEKIVQWIEYPGPNLVQEALRRAVLLGKKNFRYIDTILLDWKRNNLDSISSVEEYESRYQNKRSERDPRRRDNGRNDNGGGLDNRRRALIKKLYLT